MSVEDRIQMASCMKHLADIGGDKGSYSNPSSMRSAIGRIADFSDAAGYLVILELAPGGFAVSARTPMLPNSSPNVPYRWSDSKNGASPHCHVLTDGDLICWSRKHGIQPGASCDQVAVAGNNARREARKTAIMAKREMDGRAEIHAFRAFKRRRRLFAPPM